jgi:signal peptidase I
MEVNKTIIVFGVLAILAIVIVASANPALIQTINEHREYLYATVGVGNSMYPHIQSGDLMVIMKKTDPLFKINIGDIIVFRYEDVLVAHRVILIQDNNYYVKGDNNPNADAIIVKDNVLIGKVIEIVSHDNLIGKAVVGAML